MSEDSSGWAALQRHIEVTDAELSRKPELTQRMAKLLWGIERFNSSKEEDHPAPLHIDMAQNLADNKAARRALIALLMEMDADT